MSIDDHNGFRILTGWRVGHPPDEMVMGRGQLGAVGHQDRSGLIGTSTACEVHLAQVAVSIDQLGLGPLVGVGCQSRDVVGGDRPGEVRVAQLCECKSGDRRAGDAEQLAQAGGCIEDESGRVDAKRNNELVIDVPWLGGRGSLRHRCRIRQACRGLREPNGPNSPVDRPHSPSA